MNRATIIAFASIWFLTTLEMSGLAATSQFKRGFIDKSGRIVIKPQFDEARSFSSGMAAIKMKDKWGYINVEGVKKIQPRFDDVGPFVGGLAPVRVGKKWGYINQQGDNIVEPQFTKADKYVEGLAKVRIDPRIGTRESNCKEGFIDQTGKIAIQLEFDCQDEISTYEFHEGLVPVFKRDERSYETGFFIDKTGKTILTINSGTPHSFSNGLAPLFTNDQRRGYIDKSGKMAIELSPSYLTLGHFSEGLAPVQVDKWKNRTRKWGYIDKTGRMVIEPAFEIASNFSEGIAYVLVSTSDYKYAFINKEGKFITQRKFSDAMSFSEGMAPVLVEVMKPPIKKGQETEESDDNSDGERRNPEEDIIAGSKWGYIDKSGELIIQPCFDLASPFSEGRARVAVAK
jgi:hypothetical protein